MPPLPNWRTLAGALARPRYRILLGVVLLLLIARIAAPYALRPILVSQADAALAGRIALEDLDLSLIRGGVTLRGFEVRADELAAPDASAAEPPPPLFDAKRLWVQISWLGLLAKTLRVEELELEGFHVRLERTADGLTLPGPAPSAAGEEPAPEVPESESGSGWSLAADGVRLRDGQIAFVDHTTGDSPRRFELAVNDLSADNLELALGPASSVPGRVVLRAEVGQGSIALDARVQSLAAGPALTSTISLSKLPLAGLEAYLRMLGWSDLQAELDGEIVHRFESDGAHEVTGRLALRDVAVRVPQLEAPALAWQRLDLVLDKVDLIAQHAGVAEVVLSGARLPVDLRAPQPLPLLAPLATSAPAAGPPSEAPVEVSAAGEPSKPWTWSVGKVALADAGVELLGAGEPLPVAIDLEVRDLDGARGSRWPLRLGLAMSGGKLDVDGALAIAPPAFEGSLAIADLALPPLLARVPAPGAELLRTGVARASLRIALAPREAATGETPPTDLRVSGTLGLAGLDVGEAAATREFGATWKDLEIGIRELAAADVLTPGGPRGIKVGLQELRLAEPTVTVTRTAEGLVLPVLTASEAETAPAPSPAAAPPATAPAGPTITVDVARLRIEGARARILDRSVAPPFRSQIDRVDVDGGGLRWPGPRAERVVVALRGLSGAKFDVRGSVKPGDSKLTLKLAQLGLSQFNPYLSAVGYSVQSGSLKFDSEAKVSSDGYDSSTGLVVSQLALGGAEGEARFQNNFGIPLSLALGLLKDLNGDITLSLPIAGERGETRIALGSVVGQALRKALVGALASPLKLLGGVMSPDGKIEAIAPEPIPFPDGSAELGPDGSARVSELADLLAASPALSLTLTGGTSEADARVLRERAILAELRAATGVRALGALGEIGTRNAVRAHLEGVYSGGPPAELDAEQLAWLDARVKAQPLEPGALESLASTRVTAARLALSDLREIAPERVAPGSPTGEPVAEASVGVRLGTPQVAAP